MVVAATLAITGALGGDEAGAEPARVSTEASMASPQARPKSCFWSKGRRRWCIDRYKSKEYDDYWTNDDGWNEPWSIVRYEGDRHYTVEDHRDRVLGYLRPADWGGWRAHVFVCLDDPPKAWARQGCGFVRDGKAVPAGRNVLRVYTKGRMVGTARGPDAAAVVAHKLIGGGVV
jgi:hypothetical protein